MTAVHYNGIILRNCETQAFEQTVEYDESGTDVICSKFRIRVASTMAVYSNPPRTDTVSAEGQSVVEQAANMHARLSEARKDFWMVVEGSPTSDNGDGAATRVLLQAAGSLTGEMLAVPGQEGLIPRASVADCSNGPKPISVRIGKIIGGRALRVEFEIEIHRKLCVNDSSDPMPAAFLTPSGSLILNNRWSLTETKDDNWVTTKTIQGTLRVAHGSLWAHFMRYFCIPPILDGYKRVRQEFATDATGLELRYRIEDRQHYAAAPWPVIDWNGTHSESTTANGTLQAASVHLRVTGPMGVDKRQLIGVAGKMMTSRLFGIVKTNPESADQTYETYLKDLAIIDHMDKPTIEMRAQVNYFESDYKWLMMRVNHMGLPLDQTVTIAGYSPRVHPKPLPYDSDKPAGIFYCYLQNPCSVWHDMPGGLFPGQKQPEDPRSIKDADSESEAVVYDDPEPFEPINGTVIRDDANIYKFPYSMVTISNRYETDNGYIQLPLAKQATAGADTCAIVRMHAGVCQRVMAVEAVRIGRHPLLPAIKAELTDPNGIREVLADTTFDISAPQIKADGGTRSFAIRAIYRYLLSRPPTAAEKLRAGSLPTDATDPSGNWIDLSTGTDDDRHMQWEEAPAP